MQFSALLLPVAFTLAAAQYGYGDAAAASTESSSSSTATSSAASTSFTSTSGVVVHKVAVGKTALSFTPDSFTAAVGDEVEFHFYPKTHSVAASSFAKPCAPVNSSSFWSGGFTTTTAGVANTTVFTIKINDTNPIWIYCGFTGHCQGGMVGVINPPSSTSKTLALYKEAAAATTNTTVPAKAQGGVKGAAAQAATGTDSSPATTSSSVPGGAGALKAPTGVIAGLMSLVFAGLII